MKVLSYLIPFKILPGLIVMALLAACGAPEPVVYSLQPAISPAPHIIYKRGGHSCSRQDRLRCKCRRNCPKPAKKPRDPRDSDEDMPKSMTQDTGAVASHLAGSFVRWPDLEVVQIPQEKGKSSSPDLIDKMAAPEPGRAQEHL